MIREMKEQLEANKRKQDVERLKRWGVAASTEGSTSVDADNLINLGAIAGDGLTVEDAKLAVSRAHNDLESLQGGAPDEYYHLDADTHSYVDPTSSIQTQLDSKASQTDLDGHVNDTTVHFAEASIDHANIQNVGTKTHAEIDSHITDASNPHMVTASQVGATTPTDVDDKITTHSADASAHHSKTVSADIDHTLIQNVGVNTHATIDSHLASTSNPHSVQHSQLGGIGASDHHAKYTDTKAVSAMGTKSDTNPLNHDKATNTWRGIDDTPVNGQVSESITSNWAYDHSANANAHHTKYTDTDAIGAIEQYLGIGSSNARYVNCILEGDGRTDSTARSIAVRGTILNLVNSSDHMAMSFKLPIPHQIGDKDLYINYVNLVISDADSSNYVSQVRIFGLNSSGLTQLYSNTTHRTAAGNYSYGFTAVKASTYYAIAVYINTYCVAYSGLDVAAVRLLHYYA